MKRENGTKKAIEKFFDGKESSGIGDLCRCGRGVVVKRGKCSRCLWGKKGRKNGN